VTKGELSRYRGGRNERRAGWNLRPAYWDAVCGSMVFVLGLLLGAVATSSSARGSDGLTEAVQESKQALTEAVQESKQALVDMLTVRVALAEQNARRQRERAEAVKWLAAEDKARLAEMYYRELMRVGVFGDGMCSEHVAAAMRAADRKFARGER